MKEFYVMFAIIVLAFVLLIVGYSQRDKEWGVALIGFGVLGAFCTLLYKIYFTLNPLL